MARQSSASTAAAGQSGGGEATARKGKKAGGRGHSWLFWLVLAAILPFGFLVLPSMVLFIAGMVPTVVALIAIRDPDGFAHLSIGILNVAGVLPWLVELWKTGHDFGRVQSILTDPVCWAVMLGAAGVGWAIVAAVPPVVASIVAQYHQIAADRLGHRRQQLIDEWGFSDEAEGEEQSS